MKALPGTQVYGFQCTCGKMDLYGSGLLRCAGECESGRERINAEAKEKILPGFFSIASALGNWFLPD
jgi:hypothetical protein